MASSNLPSEHLLMDWEQAVDYVFSLFRAIRSLSEENNSIEHIASLASLGIAIVKDQIAYQEAVDREKKQHAAKPSVPSPAPDTLGPEPLPVLRAQTFELVDTENKVRARFGCEKNAPVLHFFEEDKPRVSLGLDDDGNATLHLSGERGEMLSCFVMTDGTPAIEAYDSQGKVTRRAPIYGKGGK